MLTFGTVTLIWGKDEFIVDRSITDAPFIYYTLAKISYFYYNSLMSRSTYVNSRWFIKQQTIPVPPVDHLLLADRILDNSSKDNNNILWCCCQKDDMADDMMICCDNDN